MNDKGVKSRIARILDILAMSKNVKVTDLAEILNVSQVTLRRDLDDLEIRGIIKRIHGCVYLDKSNEINYRMAYFYSIKRRIAQNAASIVSDGETIMIGSGSCCALFAEELALTRGNITIVTNSTFITNNLRQFTKLKIILLGGLYLPDSQVMVGPLTIKCAESMFIEKFFLGTDGFIPEFGFTGRDHLRVETAIKLADRAKSVFMLTEAAKFNCRGSYNMLTLDQLSGVFTDDSIPKEAENLMKKNNVLLHKVPAIEERIHWHHFPGIPPILNKSA